MSMNPFQTVKSIESFEPDAYDSSYQLKRVEPIIKQKLIRIIEKLESSDKVLLCARGDSLPLDKHVKWINEKLSYKFIVGEKARININQPDRLYHPIRTEENISEELKELINESNRILVNKSKKHSHIKGQFDIKQIQKEIYLGQIKERLKLILLSFLHNKGNDHHYKPFSPFISLTYGAKKFSKARTFALHNKDIKLGIIFVYILNKNIPYFFKSKELYQKLRSLNIEWYKDIHSEIMLLGGMYPHKLIGFFEVKRNLTPRFILNPWFYKQLVENNNFDFTNSVPINQVNFFEYASKLKYKKYIFHRTGQGQQYQSDIGRLDENELMNFATNQYRDNRWRAKLLSKWANEARDKYDEIINN